MGVIHEVREDGSLLGGHSWEMVSAKIAGLKNRNYVVLNLVGDDCELTMEYIGRLGYFIGAFGKGEIEEWLATDEGLSDEPVEVNISGAVGALPRNALVSEEVAQAVAGLFYVTGMRSSKHKWIKSNALYPE
jgi:hypothetical protein